MILVYMIGDAHVRGSLYEAGHTYEMIIDHADIIVRDGLGVVIPSDAVKLDEIGNQFAQDNEIELLPEPDRGPETPPFEVTSGIVDPGEPVVVAPGEPAQAGTLVSPESQSLPTPVPHEVTPGAVAPDSPPLSDVPQPEEAPVAGQEAPDVTVPPEAVETPGDVAQGPEVHVAPTA